MLFRFNKSIAAAAYILALPLTFLAGLLVWFVAQGRDPWLEAQGRRATLFNLAILGGYLVLTRFAPPVFLMVLWVGALIVNFLWAWRAARGVGMQDSQFQVPKHTSLAANAELAIPNPQPATRNQRRIQSGVALGFYLTAGAMLLLAPMHFDYRHALIASSHTPPNDPSGFLASLIWWPWAIGHHSNSIIPHGNWLVAMANVLWTASIPSLALLLAPVTHFCGAVVSYDIIAWLAPVLGAWITYLLAREITDKFWPSLFGGWLFGFSSYEFAHLLAFMNLFVTAVLPLAAWLYVRRRKGKLPRGWYIGCVAVVAIFQFGVSTEILASAVPLGLLAALADVFFRRPEYAVSCGAGTRAQKVRTASVQTLPPAGRWSLFLETFAGLAVAGILLLPCFYALFFVGYVRGVFGPAVLHSADPLSFLLPTVITWLGGAAAAPVSRHFGYPPDVGAYLGIPLILMLLLFIREFSHKPGGRVLIFMLAGCAVLSLGPNAEVLGHVSFIALPWSVPSHLPVFDKILPLRLVVYVWLAAAIMGAWWLAESKVRRGWKLSLAGLVVLFLFPDVFSGQWVHPVKVPPFFTTHAFARYLPRGAKVIILPYDYHGYSPFWVAQTHFYLTTPGGYVWARVPPILLRYPVVKAFYAGHPLGHDYLVQLRQFAATSGMQAIIIPDNDCYDSPALLAPLHIQPIHIGGVRLYLLKRLH
jgi:hypothetical protein